MSDRTTRTTIALPTELLEAADRAVREGKARSRNDLLAAALRRELAARERTAIDAAFEGMAGDPEALADAEALAEEFSTADWEALRLGEVEA